VTDTRKSAPLVIIAASGTAGDMLPFIALGQGLLARGHQVLMFTPCVHAALVQAAGIPCHSHGSNAEWQALLDNPDLWHERKGWGVIWQGLTPHLHALHQLVQTLPADQPCVMLSHPLLVPMAVLARATRPDLRIVCAYLAPSNLCSSHDLLTAGSLRIPRWLPLRWRQALWRLIHVRWINPTTLPGLNAARNARGLPPVAHFFDHMLGAPDASLGLFPHWFAAAQPDWPAGFIEGDFVSPAGISPPALSPELAQFLAAGTPPIVFTPGTGHRHAARYFQAAAQALARLGRRGLFITPHAAQVPAALPPGVLWQSHVPFGTLLPQVAAVVHHGGIGTTAAALRAGKPQLIVPFAYDQFDNGLRAQGLGVAEVLLARRLSARRMQRQLARLLASPEVDRACRAVAQQMADEAGPERVLDQLEAALCGMHARPA
jgi:rhamnosyltransferase subunit B